MLRNHKNRTYGWDVELPCSKCKASGLPRYEGWSPSLTTSGVGAVQVYAKVACPQCGKRLTDEAAQKLAALFRDLDIPAANKQVIGKFIQRLFLVPAGLAFILFFGMQMDWWSWGLGTIGILIVSAIALPLILVSRNKQLAQFPKHCECGKPHQVFMGSLDDAACYRCFSCGRLMKIRE